MIACTLTDGATAPGTQASSDAMVASGFLMPRRRASGVRPWISAASNSVSAGCGGGSRRSSDTVICGSALTSCRMKSSCEPCISAAIMIEKPTPVATPATATSGLARAGRTWVQAMSRMRFMASRARDDAHARAVLEFGASPGEATRSPSLEAGQDLDLARAADADLDLALAHTRPPSTTNTALPCTASAGTSSASGFSRVTTLASTLMPGLSGVSSGSAMLMR